jgi:hypothetical protein
VGEGLRRKTRAMDPETYSGPGARAHYVLCGSNCDRLCNIEIAARGNG